MTVKIYHVLPLNDLAPHSGDVTVPGPCKPRAEHHQHGILIIHNSFDGREITEQAADHAFSARN